jgi:hypothetical protein
MKDEIISRLEKWNWPPPKRAQRRFRFASAFLKWAAVAVLAGAAFVIGRNSVSSPDVSVWRAEQAEATRQQIAGMAQDIERARREDRQVWLDAISQVQSQHAADFLSLRHDLETVAATAEARLLRTQQSVMLIAAGNPPAGTQ